MKKLLLASSAIALLGLAAPASAAEMTVKLGGYVDFQAGYFDNDIDTNEFDFDNEVEVHINADGKADNGLEYGVQIQLELRTAADGDGRALRTDEASVYVGGTWGRVVLGDDDGAVADMAVYAPTVGIGQLDGIGFKFSTGFFDFQNGYAFYPDVTSDASKISYFSPSFAGFSMGISFTPEIGNEGDAVILSNTPRAKDVLEGMVAYSGEFGGFSIDASGGAMRALDDGGMGGLSNAEKTMWLAGAKVGYAGFSVGGSYVDFNNFAGSGYLFDGIWDYSWNVGAAYETGPFGVAVQYAEIKGDMGSKEKGWGAGVSYAVAPGLTLGLDYLWYKVDAGTTGVLTDDEGDMVLFSTKMAF